jgi:hypothetical protein
VIFKPTQSTIVFSVGRPGELAPEYRVHHIRAGRFGRFGETEIAEAARELAIGVCRQIQAEIVRVSRAALSEIVPAGGPLQTRASLELLRTIDHGRKQASPAWQQMPQLVLLLAFVAAGLHYGPFTESLGWSTMLTAALGVATLAVQNSDLANASVDDRDDTESNAAGARRHRDTARAEGRDRGGRSRTAGARGANPGRVPGRCGGRRPRTKPRGCSPMRRIRVRTAWRGQQGKRVAGLIPSLAWKPELKSCNANREIKARLAAQGYGLQGNGAI